MPRINDHYLKLKAGYLFPEIGRRVTAFTSANPDAAKTLIRCGIGDVTEPLPEACRTAIHAATATGPNKVMIFYARQSQLINSKGLV